MGYYSRVPYFRELPFTLRTWIVAWAGHTLMLAPQALMIGTGEDMYVHMHTNKQVLLCTDISIHLSMTSLSLQYLA